MIRNGLRRVSSIQFLNRPVALLLAVQLLGGMVLSQQRFFFPIYVEEQLGYTEVAISAFVAVGLFLGMIASIIAGALSDSIGRKWTLILGLYGFFLGSLMYMVGVPWLVLLFWCASSLGLGFHAVGGEGYLINSARSAHLGVLSAFYYWGFTFGGALGSLAAGIILDREGFTGLGVFLLLVSAATALGSMAFLPRLRPASQARAGSWRQSLVGYRDVIRQPQIALLGLLRFLPTCYWGIVAVLIPLSLNRVSDTKTVVALYATFSQVLASLAQVVTGQAADRWGPRRPTFVAFSGVVASAIGLAGFGTEVWGLYAFGILGACSAWSLSTLMPSLVSLAATGEEQGRVVGALNFLWNMAMMTGAIIGGTLVGIAAGLPYLVAAALNAGAIALAVLFFRRISLQPVPATGDTKARLDHKGDLT